MIAILQNIYSGLTSFFESCVDLFKYIGSLLRDSINFFDILQSTILHLPQIFGFLPTAVVSMIVGAFGVLIFLRIIGRD